MKLYNRDIERRAGDVGNCPIERRECVVELPEISVTRAEDRHRIHHQRTSRAEIADPVRITKIFWQICRRETRCGYEIPAEPSGLAKAEALFQEVVKSRTAKLGVDHPDTLTTKHNLALLYQAGKRYDLAESLFLEVVEASRRKLGPGHPYTQQRMRNLILFYEERGQPTPSRSPPRKALRRGR